MDKTPSSRIVIVKEPSKMTLYYCSECDYASNTVNRLQKHKTISGHLSKGKTDIVADLQENVFIDQQSAYITKPKYFENQAPSFIISEESLYLMSICNTL